jgi:uncharacterized protein (UPF0264 family)
LVSVRSAAEALAALEGGASLIDVKEPDRGSLGRASPDVIAGVVAAVDGRCPVSAALGELIDGNDDPLPAGLAFAKWGLAGYGTDPAWRARLRGGPHHPAVVAVAYADWQCARAPAVDDVFAHVAQRRGRVLLLDTHCKDAARRGQIRPTLLDWLPLHDIAALCAACRSAGVRIALAGSLGADEIRKVVPLAPDWIAVRGAACDGGREGTVSTVRVRELAALIRSSRHLVAES